MVELEAPEADSAIDSNGDPRMGSGIDPLILPEGGVMVEVEGLGDARPRVNGAALPPLSWGTQAEGLTVALARHMGLYDHALEVPRGLKAGTCCLVRGVSEEAGQALVAMAQSLGMRAHVRPIDKRYRAPSSRQVAILALTNTAAFFALIFAVFAPFPIWLRLGVLFFAFTGGAVAMALEGRGVPLEPIFSRNLRRHLAPAFAQGVDPWVPQLEGPVGQSAEEVPGGVSKAVVAVAPLQPSLRGERRAASPKVSASEEALVTQWRALEVGSRGLDLPGPVRQDLDPLISQVGEKVEGLRHRLRVVEAGEALKRTFGVPEDGSDPEKSQAHKDLRRDILELSELMMTLSTSLQGARGFEGDGRQVLEGAKAAMAGYLSARGEVEGG